MKTWKKVVLWVFAIVVLAVAIVAAFVAGVYKEAMWTARDQARYDNAFHGAHYFALKEIETEELAQTRQWRQVTGNLQIMVYNAVQFIDEHPGYFVYEGRSKESFDRSLENARKIAEEVDQQEFVPFRQITEAVMGTTNLTVTRGRDFVRYSRNKEAEKGEAPNP